MFTGQAEEALRFYVSIFPDSELVDIEHYGADEANEGTVKRATFTLAGQSFLCIDSPPMHAFTFTPSVSFFFDCESESQISAPLRSLVRWGRGIHAPRQIPICPAICVAGRSIRRLVATQSGFGVAARSGPGR